MSISNNYVPLKQLGNGVTTEFSDNWQILSADYIQVFLEDVTTGVQTPVDQGGAADEYTVSFDDSGFIVTFGTAPTSSNYVVIGRAVALDQSTPYKTSKGFQGEVTEDSFDKLTAITQDLSDEISRAPKTPLGGTPLTFDAYSAGKVLGWSPTEDGKVVSSVNTIDDMEGAITAVAALSAQSGVKVSANDTTVGFLNGKLIAGDDIKFTENNDGANETMTIGVNNDVNIVGAIGGGTQDLDMDDGRAISATVDTSETTFTFSNPLATGKMDGFYLILTNGGSQTINWPASVDWIGGAAPDLTAAGVDHLVFTTIDGGTIWNGFVVGFDVK